MRLGWSQSRVFVAASFTRVDNPPLDGAARGSSSGLAVPPFPPALETDETLYLGIWLAGDDPEVLAIDRTGYFGEYSLEEFHSPVDRMSLTVDGVDGYYFPSTNREYPPTNESSDVLSVTLGGGPLLITAPMLEEHIAEADAHHVPVDHGPSGFTYP